MTTLIEKYRAKSFSDIKGQDLAIKRVKEFFKNFPEKKALILNGPAGVGKTSLAYALANEVNAEILEINASDLRNKDQVSKIVGQASEQCSLFNKNKILLVDEVDGISKEDHGGVNELLKIIGKTCYPVILTANDIWDKKLVELRKKAEVINLKELDYKTVFQIISDISEKEKLFLSDNILNSLAIKCRGDVRAAINDLQTLHPKTKNTDLHERDKENDIFHTLQQVFKSLPNEKTTELYDNVNLSLDEILLWLEENIPKEYKDEELFRAFDALSRADVFRGRIYRQQHWRFQVYQKFFMSFAIAAAKKKGKLGFTKYERPARILKIWLINQKNAIKKSIAEKYAKYCHIGKKRTMQEFFVIRKIIKDPKIMDALKLDEKEKEFLINS